MRRWLGITVFLFSIPAAAQSVQIDYAKDVDFQLFKTFQYVETKDTNTNNTLMGDRIVVAIKSRLESAGLKEVEQNPDFYITYHTATQDRQSIDTTGYGYSGYGRGWYGWGRGPIDMTTTVSTYTDGTLIIDAYEPKDTKMVWRGTGTVTVKSKPEKQVQQVERILDKLGARWHKILKNQGE